MFVSHLLTYIYLKIKIFQRYFNTYILDQSLKEKKLIFYTIIVGGDFLLEDSNSSPIFKSSKY